jgi:alkyldihydroxyacetonephosphate synthase
VLDEADRTLLDATMAVVEAECLALDGQRAEEALVERWWAHRNDVSALVPLYGAGIIVDTVEIAARWAVLEPLYESALHALGSVPGTLVASAHQSHAYVDGACLYFTFAGRRPDAEETAAGGDDVDAERRWAEKYYRAAWDVVMDVVHQAGGAISHHHGIGLNRARFMERALGGSFSVLRALKESLDPGGILNPGKLGLPSPFGEARWP